MPIDLKNTMASLSAVSIESVKASNRLFSIIDAVDTKYLDKIKQIDWLQEPGYTTDYHYGLRRRSLTKHNNVMSDVDCQISELIPIINQVTGQQYVRISTGLWQICEPGYICKMHTDGTKPNVMIIYWQAPSIRHGTTFYSSQDPTDIFHEFLSIPNTGFFANYNNGGQMWHASLAEVPLQQHRLITQYEFFYR